MLNKFNDFETQEGHYTIIYNTDKYLPDTMVGNKITPSQVISRIIILAEF